MKLNPTSFLSAPAALAASLGQLDVTCDHKSITALHHDIESRSLAAIDEKYSHFKVSSSWTSPDCEAPPETLRQYLGAGHFNQLARIEPRFAVLYIAAILIGEIYKFRGVQTADIANITRPLNSDLHDICRWYAPADANGLVDAVKNYVEERAGQQVRLRNDWTTAKIGFFTAMADNSIVLGRVNGQGLAQKTPRDRVPYLTFRDRTNFKGEREAIAVFEDGSGDVLTNIKIRRAPNQTPQFGTPAASAYAETHTGMAGRPSARELVGVVLAERIAANTICETLTAEAKAVEAIVARRLRPEDAKPKLRTIENHIRVDYHKAKRSGKGTS
jgi:hypothetical protein